MLYPTLVLGCLPLIRMKFRTYFGNPPLIEDVLVKHPKLKVQLMHMGYPFLEEAKAILFVYPQVNVDIAVIDWIIPRTDFYNYLKALIDGGFEKRIMYGSDQMIWSDAISLSIKNIEDAPFLSQEQKQDIFFNNAAKFFNIGQ
jgi:predicted TIM-barrel fold metal-dependent hydrolase